MAQTDQKPAKPAAKDTQWDVKRGKPKDAAATQVVENAHGRYSASGQGEDDQRRDPPKPPQSHTEDGYAHEPKLRMPKPRQGR